MRFSLTSALKKALVVAALAAVAFSPASAQVPSGAHKLLKGAWTKFLDNSVPPAKLADELAAAGGGKTASLAKLAEEAAEVRKFLDDRASAVVTGTPAASTAVGGKAGLNAVAVAIDTSVGARVPGAIDDVANALTILARQAETAKLLNGGRMPAGFDVPDGAGEVLEAIAKRTQAQKAAGGGRMFRLRNGDYMSLAENKGAHELLERVKNGGHLSNDDLKQVIAATKAKPGERTAFEGLLFQRYRSHASKQSSGGVKGGGKADNAISPKPEPDADAVPAVGANKKGSKADELDVRDHAVRASKRGAAEITASLHRADFGARVKITGMIEEPGHMRMLMREAGAADGDPFKIVSHLLGKQLAENSKHKLSPLADDVLDALRSKANDLDELRKLSPDGKLPAGVADMPAAEKAVMDKLQKFFDGPPRPMQDFDGTFYSPIQMKYYAWIKQAARDGDWTRINRDIGAGPFLSRLLQHTDTAMERSVRATLKRADAKLGTGSHRYMDYRPYLEWDKVRTVLNDPVVHRDLADESKWVTSRYVDGRRLPFNEAAEVKRIVAGIEDGTLEYTAKVVSRIRSALLKGTHTASGTGAIGTRIPGDIVIMRALLANDEALFKVMAPRWDAPVWKIQSGGIEGWLKADRPYPASFVAPDPADVAARQAAKKAELDTTARETAERLGSRNAADLARLANKANREARLSANLFIDNPTYWYTEISSSTYSSASLQLRAKRLHAGDLYELVRRRVMEFSEKGSRKQARPAADEALSALNRKAKNVDDAKALNNGVLPEGVPDMTVAERETLELLREWKKAGRRVKDADGWYYSMHTLQEFDDVMRRLGNVADGSSSFVPHTDQMFLRRLLKYGDTELEKQARAKVTAMKSKLPDEVRAMVDEAPLTREPVSNPDKWLSESTRKLASKDYRLGTWTKERLQELAAKVESGTTSGWTVPEVKRLREAITHYTGDTLNSASGTLTLHRVQDIYFMQLLEQNGGKVLEEVMHPRWDQLVYKHSMGFENTATGAHVPRPYLDGM